MIDGAVSPSAGMAIERCLKDSIENEKGLTWSRQMLELIQEMMHENNIAPQEGISEERIAEFKAGYDAAVETAAKEYESNPLAAPDNNLCERKARIRKWKINQAISLRSFEHLIYAPLFIIRHLAKIKKLSYNYFRTFAFVIYIHQKHSRRKQKMKKYQDLTFVDDFMFCKVMTARPDLCRRVLSLVLQKNIKQIVMHGAQQSVAITPNAKAIRMDVYLDDAGGTVYDLEMQASLKRCLPRRLRYYQAMLDLNHLESGKDYAELPHTVIIFICTFDFFNKQLPIYTFENRCVQMSGLRMEDGAEKIFVNPDSRRDGLDTELNAFLDYLQGKKAACALTQEIDDAVVKARNHKEWEVEYMTWQAFEMDARREAREEGRREDIARMLRNGKSAEQIASFCGYDMAEVRAVQEKLLHA